MAWFQRRRARAAVADVRDLTAYRAAWRAGDHAEAERLARVLVERNPNDHVMIFDLALAAKRRRDWDEAAVLNDRALSLMPKLRKGEPAAWNLGIAATALGDWEGARRAWRAFGVDVPDDGPAFPHGLGPVPVRLNPTDTELGEEPLEIDGTVHAAEVVWAQRLSPAHARVVSVPSPESGHRWGDVVLTDGVPHGERFDGRRWVPVFDELAVLERSGHATWAASLQAPTADDVADLLERAEAAGLGAEDWTAALRILCLACSEGRPRHEHAEPLREWAPERSFAVAAVTEDEVREVLDKWSRAGVARGSSAPERVL